MITSTTNPRIKSVARLRQRSRREVDGRFPIEGARVVARAHSARWPLVEGFVAPGLANREATQVAEVLAGDGVPMTELGNDAFRKIAYRQHPDGIVAIGRTVGLGIDRLTLPERPLILVVEAIEKPGNLGAMLRTADGAGVDAVIAADAATDLYNPNVVRASQGALFTVPLAVASPADVLAWLATSRVAILPAGPEEGRAPWDHDLTGAVAIVIGSEHAGLSSAWKALPRITLPMAGTSDSLNASTAAAIVLYEAVRQRIG